jgi:hypothetical protein
MTLDERLKAIRTSLVARDDDPDLPHEIRGLFNLVDYGCWREKILSALALAEIYIDPKRVMDYGPHGRERVRGFIFQDLSTALEILRELRQVGRL